MSYMATPLKTRMLSRVEFDTNGGCWLWSGAINPGGYGIVQVGRGVGTKLAHRASYAEFVGEIGDLHVCHKCDVRQCINPDHLWLGTRHENMQDSSRKGRAKGPRLMGEKNPASKLKDSDILKIREECREGPRGTQRKMSKQFGVSEAVISKVILNRGWKHV